MRKKVSFFALIVVSFFILSHTNKSDVWTEYYSDHQIKISYKDSPCADVENGTNNNYVLLKVENKTNNKLTVSFKKETWYDGKCQNCHNTSDEFNTSVTLEPFEKMEGSCKSSKNLRIFSQMNNQFATSRLTKFDLKNLEIAPK